MDIVGILGQKYHPSHISKESTARGLATCTLEILSSLTFLFLVTIISFFIRASARLFTSSSREGNVIQFPAMLLMETSFSSSSSSTSSSYILLLPPSPVSSSTSLSFSYFSIFCDFLLLLLYCVSDVMHWYFLWRRFYVLSSFNCSHILVCIAILLAVLALALGIYVSLSRCKTLPILCGMLREEDLIQFYFA